MTSVQIAQEYVNFAKEEVKLAKEKLREEKKWLKERKKAEELEYSFVLYGYVGKIMDGTPKERKKTLTALQVNCGIYNDVREHLPNDLDMNGYEYIETEDGFII